MKKVISIILCIIICINTIPSVALANERDTSFEETLALDLKQLGIFKGVSNTNFDLDRNPSRIETLVMLIRVLGKEDDALNGTWKYPFTDVPMWADKYVGYAYENGLTRGISATQFGNESANAAMYLTFVLRALGYSDTNGDFTWNNPFALSKGIGILPNMVNTKNFLRADVVLVSYAALPVNLKGSTQTLAQKLIASRVFKQELYNNCYDKDAINTHTHRLKTSGGAVLVGTVGKNANGEYCLKLDDKINVELNYCLDNPEIFENCDEILLYNQSEDKIDKSAYEGMQVTIKGVLQNYRGAGRLYVYVCYIEAQRSSETCYADESIQIGQYQEWVSDYDPTKPLPEKMNPKVKNGVYVFNPYTLNINTLRHFGNDFADFYIDFVDAFLNYETSVYCPNEYYADMFSSIVTTDFFLFDGDGVIGEVTTYDKSTSTLHWTYNSKNKAEHNAIIRNFENQINCYLSHVSPSDSEVVKAEKLYHYLCISLTYNYDAMDTREKVEPYYGFTKHTGICYTFANDYTYLLSMVGIDSNVVSGSIEVGETEDEKGHVWNIVKLNDKYYYCDPTYELSYRNGTAFVYFGMTYEDRLNDNTNWIEDSILVGVYNILEDNKINLSTSPLQIVPFQ